MTTIAKIEEEAHIELLKKQMEFRTNKRKVPTMGQMVNKLVLDGINQLGLDSFEDIIESKSSDPVKVEEPLKEGGIKHKFKIHRKVV